MNIWIFIGILTISSSLVIPVYGEEVSFSGYLNALHSHYQNGTSSDEFYVFDYTNYQNPPIRLLVTIDDLDIISQLYDNLGTEVTGSGTKISDNVIQLDSIGPLGAIVELDQKVYSWTGKVYITIVAPGHNQNGNLIEEIGNTDSNPVKISTRGHSIDKYKLVETGTDTGIFTGEVVLTGFSHDADGNATTGSGGIDTNPTTSLDGTGPRNGFLEADSDDGITVSFEFAQDQTVVGSALINWNIGQVGWLSPTYPANDVGFVRVVDPDMNLDPDNRDSFVIDVWSDSDLGGIDLNLVETDTATGIFEGTVFFSPTSESSGNTLRVSVGDNVTAEYEDNTLPAPYTPNDDLDIAGVTKMGDPIASTSGLSVAVNVSDFSVVSDSFPENIPLLVSGTMFNKQSTEAPYTIIFQISKMTYMHLS